MGSLMTFFALPFLGMGLFLHEWLLSMVIQESHRNRRLRNSTVLNHSAEWRTWSTRGSKPHAKASTSSFNSNTSVIKWSFLILFKFYPLLQWKICSFFKANTSVINGASWFYLSFTLCYDEVYVQFAAVSTEWSDF